MTRQEFIDDIEDFDDLLRFCSDWGVDLCEDVVYDYDYDSYINDDISESDCDWTTLRDMLNDLPDGGYSYYRRNGSLDYDGLDGGDFRFYKQDVLEWMDDYGEWDPEEDEEEEEMEDDEPEDDEPVVEINLNFVISVGQNHLQMLMDDAAKADKEDAALVDAATDLILSSV